MIDSAPEESRGRVIRWPWQLTAVSALLVLTGSVYLLVTVGTVIAAAFHHGPTKAELLLTLALSPLAAAFLLTGLRLGRRPTWVWWWAGLGCVTLLTIGNGVDSLIHDHRIKPAAVLWPGLAVVALLTPRVRQVVAFYDAAAQARRTAATSGSPSVEPVPSDSATPD